MEEGVVVTCKVYIRPCGSVFIIIIIIIIIIIASEIRTLQRSSRKQKDDCLSEGLEQVKNSLPKKAERAVELATEKGSSNWLNVIPLKELDYNLNKKEIRDAIKLPHDWEITDTPMICARGVQFNMDHAMVCQRGGFVRMADECVKYHSTDFRS